MSENNGDPNGDPEIEDMQLVIPGPTQPVARDESKSLGGTVKSFLEECFSLPSVFLQRPAPQLDDVEHFDFHSEDFRELASEPKRVLKDKRQRQFPKERSEAKEALGRYEGRLKGAFEEYDEASTKVRKISQEFRELKLVMKKAEEEAKIANADIKRVNYEMLMLDRKDLTAKMIVNDDVDLLSEALPEKALAYGGLADEDNWMEHPDKISAKVQLMMNAGYKRSPHCPNSTMRIWRNKHEKSAVFKDMVKDGMGYKPPKSLSAQAQVRVSSESLPASSPNAMSELTHRTTETALSAEKEYIRQLTETACAPNTSPKDRKRALRKIQALALSSIEEDDDDDDEQPSSKRARLDDAHLKSDAANAASNNKAKTDEAKTDHDKVDTPKE